MTLNHDHPRNEAGLSGGAVWCPTHGEWGGGVHLHYFRTFREGSRWAWGLGAEQVWTDEGHAGLSAGVRYRVLPRLEVALMPGVMVMQHAMHGSGNEAFFAAHAEAVYHLVEAGRFHLGPMVEYSWTREESHFMFGVHTAYSF